MVLLEEVGERVSLRNTSIAARFWMDLARAACDRLRWVDLVEYLAHWEDLVRHFEHEFLFGKAQLGDGTVVSCQARYVSVRMNC